MYSSDPSSSSTTSNCELSQRLRAIDEVDKKILDMMRQAQLCIAELSKEKQVLGSYSS